MRSDCDSGRLVHDADPGIFVDVGHVIFIYLFLVILLILLAHRLTESLLVLALLVQQEHSIDVSFVHSAELLELLFL